MVFNVAVLKLFLCPLKLMKVALSVISDVLMRSYRSLFLRLADNPAHASFLKTLSKRSSCAMRGS